MRIKLRRLCQGPWALIETLPVFVFLFFREHPAFGDPAVTVQARTFERARGHCQESHLDNRHKLRLSQAKRDMWRPYPALDLITGSGPLLPPSYLLGDGWGGGGCWVRGPSAHLQSTGCLLALEGEIWAWAGAAKTRRDSGSALPSTSPGEAASGLEDGHAPAGLQPPTAPLTPTMS